MISCREDSCSETFENKKHMEVHFSKEHDNSAKEKSICKECGKLIEYYPSSKDGLYCSKCQKERPWDSGMEEGMQLSSDLPKKFHQKAYAEEEIGERKFDLSPERRGDVSETEVKKQFQQRNVAILEPTTDNEPYDLVVETNNGKFLRIQIKTGNIKNGSVTFNHRSTHTNSNGSVDKNYEQSEVDLFAVPTTELDEVFLIPFNEVGSGGIHLRVLLPKVNRNDYRWATDYTFDEIWTEIIDEL